MNISSVQIRFPYDDCTIAIEVDLASHALDAIVILISCADFTFSF